MRPIGTAEELERRRRRAVELVKQGESPADIARILGVRPHLGLPLAEARPPVPRGAGRQAPPRPHAPALTDEQLKELEGLLLQGAKAHGWPNALWTAHRVAEMIRRHFGVDYHAEHVRKIIRRRLSWSSQKPQKKAKQRNEDAIAH